MSRPFGSKNRRTKERPERPQVQQPEDQRIRHIALTRGEVAIVDAEDYERVNAYRWRLLQVKRSKYAVREDASAKGTGSMHRLIMNAPDGMDVDHINCDGLDNRKANLRLATRQQNIYNSRLAKTNTSGFKGVYAERGGRFKAQIVWNGKYRFLGRYNTATEAHAAYMGAARIVAGEFARAA